MGPWAIAILLTAASHAGDALVLGNAPVPTGTRIHSIHRTDLDLDLVIDGGARRVSVGKVHEQHSRIRVLAASRRGPVRFEVAWTRNHQRDHGPDGRRAFDLPVAGHTYVVDLDTHAITRGGSTPPARQRATVEQASDLFELLERLRAMFGDQPLSVGDCRAADPMFAGLVRDAPGEVAVDGELVLQRIVDGVALFGLQLLLVSEGAIDAGVHAHVVARLEGEVRVDVATGWTQHLRVEGPIEVDGHGTRLGRAFTLKGAGTFSSDTRLAFHTGDAPAPAD